MFFDAIQSANRSLNSVIDTLPRIRIAVPAIYDSPARKRRMRAANRNEPDLKELFALDLAVAVERNSALRTPPATRGQRRTDANFSCFDPSRGDARISA